MNSLNVATHLRYKPSVLYQKDNVPFSYCICFLKISISLDLRYKMHEIDLVYDGKLLRDDRAEICTVLSPNDTVHCFHKFNAYERYEPPEEIDIMRIQKLFDVTAGLVADNDFRCNMLSYIFNTYTELENREGLETLLRDAFMNNTLYEPEVVEMIAKQYRILCIIGPQIADYILKELAKYEGNYFSESDSDEEEYMRKISLRQLEDACRKIQQINLGVYPTQQDPPITYSIVIKDLSCTTGPHAVKLALQILDHNVINLHYLDSILSGTPKRIFYIDLKPDVNNEEIFKVTTLLRQTVRIELPRQREVDLLRGTGRKSGTMQPNVQI